MKLSFKLDQVDYIALCPGYTSRLLHDENTYEVVDDKDLLEKVREPEKYYTDFRNRYGYSFSKPNIKRTATPEFCFWQWGHTDDGLDPCRKYGAPISDCPNYEENEYDSVEAFEKDFQPYVKPLLINSSDVYIFDDEAKTIINTFFPKYMDDLHGSIVFGPTKTKFLNLVDWIILAQTIDISFCACYAPCHPYGMKIVHNNNKTILIVEFDCESG